MPSRYEARDFAYAVTPVYYGVVYPEEVWCSSYPRHSRRSSEQSMWSRLTGWFARSKA
ncbi:hypothetical protein [Paracoccus aminophilus]|uniref:hypothetical protein n=1 Tax=Paracoccus aminophilus TaxID=34003 RepID=UPI0004246D51|nr:hypothetical protein [Paracoccus aminophilus]